MRKLVLAALAAAALAAAAPAEAATVTIQIARSGFSPKSVTIAFGDKVTWRNADTADHQIVADNGAFASPILKAGATYSFEFKAAGRYPYHDALKPTLKGTIVVKGPPPSITLGLSQPIVFFGQQITLTGVVSSKKAGESVTLFQLPQGQPSLVQLAVVLTGSGGVFTFVATPSILTSYEARWRGAISAQAHVQVKPKITFLPRARRFYAKVTAGVSLAGRFVYLQRRSGFGQWVTVRKLRLGPLSGRIFSIPRAARTFTYRIYLTVNQAGPGYLDSASGTQRVPARKP
jgi:plastocyanin